VNGYIAIAREIDVKKKPQLPTAALQSASAQSQAEMEAWATRVAERDADAVREVLVSAGVVAGADGTVGLAAGAMLDIAAVLRMRSWEGGGIAAHREVGLPCAAEARHRLISRMLRESPTAEAFGELSQGVRRAYATQFVWSAPGLVGADIALSDTAGEDLLLDALAAFLWEGRNALPEKA